ncbi:hypothetical protein [Paracoccus sp. (in: a-proteobacteria)]|uniref:hypothetical protein n=1 Tax=Paracoccus sp. TaxID=267 RepID=UPI003A84AFD5
MANAKEIPPVLGQIAQIDVVGVPDQACPALKRVDLPDDLPDLGSRAFSDMQEMDCILADRLNFPDLVTQDPEAGFDKIFDIHHSPSAKVYYNVYS